MKQYTTEEQTAKLIKLGFEKPKNTRYVQRAKARNLHSSFIEFGEPELEGSYSIGELIEMLEDTPDIEICRYNQEWRIDADYLFASNQELIDALVNMAEQLKEEGVI